MLDLMKKKESKLPRTHNDIMDIIGGYKNQVPVPIVALAEDLGIQVFKSSGWPPGVAGKIQKSKEYGGASEYAIFVNSDHSEPRRRFTIAHEIAHYVWHREEIGDGIYDLGTYRNESLANSVEQKADTFAAELPSLGTRWLRQ